MVRIFLIFQPSTIVRWSFIIHSASKRMNNRSKGWFTQNNRRRAYRTRIFTIFPNQIVPESDRHRFFQNELESYRNYKKICFKFYREPHNSFICFFLFCVGGSWSSASKKLFVWVLVQFTLHYEEKRHYSVFGAGVNRDQ